MQRFFLKETAQISEKQNKNEKIKNQELGWGSRKPRWVVARCSDILKGRERKVDVAEGGGESGTGDGWVTWVGDKMVFCEE